MEGLHFHCSLCVSQEDDRQSDNLDVCFGFTEAGTKALIEEMRSISASFREDARKMKDKEGLESKLMKLCPTGWIKT